MDTSHVPIPRGSAAVPPISWMFFSFQSPTRGVSTNRSSSFWVPAVWNLAATARGETLSHASPGVRGAISWHWISPVPADRDGQPSIAAAGRFGTCETRAA